MSFVAVEYQKDVTEYPSPDFSFSPDRGFPEYLFKESFSSEPNHVYEMVRNLLYIAGLDRERYGDESWNPLGEYIIPGNTVLIKPNWVENKNKHKEINDNLACLVTNPAVVRPIIDYVLIALKGKGKIIIADAPMQGCDLKELFRIAGYDRLFSFYRELGIDIEIRDMRKYSVKQKYRGVFEEPVRTENDGGSILVNLGNKSLHAEKDRYHPRYKVEDYLQRTTASYHSDGRHAYEVSALPLQADVIINMPKPKTHRLAGMTGAVKNFVGITYEKASLPHRIEGDSEKEHGDAYKKHSIWKDRMSELNERRTYYSRKGKAKVSKFYDLSMKACYVIGSALSGDKYRIGSWYGNDTIWRTAVDLNYIIMHCDRDGRFHDEAVRKIISIGDMIVAGQKDGPVGPSLKKLGMLVLSDNNLAFDDFVCNVMGFDDAKLPLFNNDKALRVFGFENKDEMTDTMVYSDNKMLDGKGLKDIEYPDIWEFEPHPMWKGHIEKNS